MATRKVTADTGFSFDAIKPEVSEIVPQTTKQRKPNAFYDFVADANQDGNHGKWFKVGPIPEAHKLEAYNMLRRAQKDLACGLNIREEDNGNGTFTYHYSAKPKKNMSYTAEDIRAWARTTDMDPAEYTGAGKLSLGVRNAYRRAMGLKELKR
jgi:hypothetical protein